jgi:hypothetical protein
MFGGNEKRFVEQPSLVGRSSPLARGQRRTKQGLHAWRKGSHALGYRQL